VLFASGVCEEVKDRMAIREIDTGKVYCKGIAKFWRKREGEGGRPRH
jgi:hypothetical protein